MVIINLKLHDVVTEVQSKENGENELLAQISF